MFVGNQGHKFLQPFREGAFLALVVVGKVGVEVEGLLLLSHEEVQNLYQNFAYLRVKLNVIFGFLADLDGKQPQTVLNLLEALLREVLAHGVEGVEELEEPDKTADDLYLKEALFFGLILVGIVVCLGHFDYDVDQLLDIQGNLQVLLLNLHEHAR